MRPVPRTFEALPADGSVIVCPDGDELRRLIEDNVRRRAGRPVVLAGREWVRSTDAMVVITGHQPEFFHPGIWIKSVVAAEVAARFGGRAEFLLVDSDSAEGVELSWPVQSESGLTLGRAALPAARGQPLEAIERRSQAEWQEWFRAVPDSILADDESPLPDFVRAFLNGGPDAGYVDRWKAGMSAVDDRVGVPSLRARPVSRLGDAGESDAWWWFVAHCLLESERCAATYNAALRAYRRRYGIQGERHPMPDLAVGGGRCELPFWGLLGGAVRSRLAIATRAEDGLELWAGDARVGEVSKSELRRTPLAGVRSLSGDCTLRARALALTAFTRMTRCDVFIHGLGGAAYDEIADDWMRTFFGVEPPGIVMATATLRLELPVRSVGAWRPDAARRTLRDRRYNPQRLPLVSANAAELLAERSAAIHESEHLRQFLPTDRAARRAAFDRIRAANLALQRHLDPAITVLDERQIERVEAHNRVAERRDWFVALHRVERLRRLVDNALALLAG